MPTKNSVRLIVQSTPENATTVIDAVQQHQAHGQGHGDERPDVLGDALVGIGQAARRLQADVGAVGEIDADQPSGEPVAPEQAEELLRVARQDRRHRRSGEHHDVAQRLPEEAAVIAVLERRHEVAPDVAVHHVQAVDGEEDEEQRAAQEDRSGPHLAGEEVADCPDEVLPRLAVGPRPGDRGGVIYGAAGAP